jgi:hypothetical protein
MNSLAGAGRLCAVALALGAAGVAAAATPAKLTWSTYLRSGPGATYPVVGELEHDTPVALAGCQGGWCHVSTDAEAGFVDQAALTLPRLAAPQPPARMGCVDVAEPDGRGAQAVRVCSAAPSPQGASPQASPPG